MPEPVHLVGDRYELGEMIGRGGMADVHRARDRVLHRDVAVKVLREVTSVDAERFATEARLLARLNHHSVVAVLDAGVTDARPWLALELVDGRPLDDVLRDDVVDPAALAALAAQVADGLAHAHAAGVVHRDVKPSNVLVTAAGRAKLADFGIARLADGAASLTRTGHTIGTAAYLSPEQVRGDVVGSASDVYALGLVLLEALTGTRAYPGPPVEAALARLHHTPLIPTSLPPGWPGLVAAMTLSRPDERPSAQAVGDRLRELAGVAPVAAPVAASLSTASVVLPLPAPVMAPVPTPAMAPKIPVREGRRRPWAVLVAAAVVVLLSIAALARGNGSDAVPAAAGEVGASTPATPSRTPTAGAGTATSSAPVVPAITPTNQQPKPVTKHRPSHRAKHRPSHRAKHGGKRPGAQHGTGHRKPHKPKSQGQHGKGPKKNRH